MSPADRDGSADRAHLPFMLAGLAAALLVGFALGPSIPLFEHGSIRLGGPGIEGVIQAHGAAQLSGWAGLLVVGMGLRLLPRFGGRPPLSPAVAATIWLLLVPGLVLCLAGQLGGPIILLPLGLFLQALGRIGFAVAIGVIISTVTTPRRSWMIAVLAGVMGWLAWAAADLFAATTARGGLIPDRIISASSYIALFTAIGPFIWAVQSRSVPTFFARQEPTTWMMAVPCAGFVVAAGLLLSTAGLPSNSPGVFWWAVLIAGLATCSVAPMAGQLTGKPTRLRAASRPLAAFVIAANRWAVAAGGLLVVASFVALTGRADISMSLADGARHAFGIGTVSLIIMGMAELLAPEFAMARLGSPGSVARLAPLWLLSTAAAIRVMVDLPPMTALPTLAGPLVGTAGILAWTALAAFASLLLRALRADPYGRSTLEE